MCCCNVSGGNVIKTGPLCLRCVCGCCVGTAAAAADEHGLTTEPERAWGFGVACLTGVLVSWIYIEGCRIANGMSARQRRVVFLSSKKCVVLHVQVQVTRT